MTLPFESQLPRQQLEYLEQLWADGFVRIRGLLAPGEIAALQAECSRMMRDQPRVPWSEKSLHGQNYRVPVYVDADWSVLSNIAGLSPQADAILERLFTHIELVPVLRAILGTGYKICQIGIRRSAGRDGGLRMHQDASGEFSIGLLLNDVGDEGGTTAFLPGTHRFPLRSAEAGMPYIHPRHLRRWAKPASGLAGDVFLFFNKTWHGRLPTDCGTPHDAILLNMFGPGYEYMPFEAPREVLAALPAELRRLLDPAAGLERLESGRCRVLGSEARSDRLVDAAYGIPASQLHPAQLLRLLVPLFKAMLPIKRWAQRRA
jgi:putative 2OG-Fe(II) oxygenase